MIIGLIGPKGSGKTELAKLLTSQLHFKRIAFADPIKQMLEALVEYQGGRIGHARRMFWGDLKEKPSVYLNGAISRWAMQTLGTEWGRKLIHEDLWVDVWKNKIKSYGAYQVLKFVVEDLRFKNEEKAVRELGGKIVLITRKGCGKDDPHVSENEYLTIQPDWSIHNDGTTQQLLDKFNVQYRP